MRTLTTAVLLAATAVAAGAADLSIFQFSEDVYATAVARGQLHRVAIPGGEVLATRVNGQMGQADVEDGVALVASVPFGVGGRQVHMDMGQVRQVELGSRLALVTAAQGTAIYFPGTDRLQGVRISEGHPVGVMVHRDIAAVNWTDKVALYGFRKGYLVQLVFDSAGLQGISLAEDSVVTLWGEDRGTFLHVLSDQGFRSMRLSYSAPGEFTARSGMNTWAPIHGDQDSGAPFEQLQPLVAEGAGVLARDPAAFGSARVVP